MPDRDDQCEGADEVAPIIGFADALRFWFRLGLISFGGPAGQIAIMHDELVERRRWISEKRFLHALNFCMMLPGPEAQQLATYLGWLMHRTAGGIAAGTLFVLPSLVLLVLLSWIYMAFGHLAVVEGIFHGLKPAVTALVAHAAYRIGTRVLHNAWLWAIAVVAFVAIALIHLPYPAIVLAAAAIGYLGSRLRPDAFLPRALQPGASAHAGPAVIDDDTPAPLHARFRRGRVVTVLGVGFLLWAAPSALLVATQGRAATLTAMAWFFTKAAWLTFGGAYAVLPYVVQGAVDQYHWLTSAQMLDGLALGETTPGPLIMVVAFVGFVGGWSQGVSGLSAPIAAGAAAAVVATYFSFLPSFIMVLAGGPLIESTQGQRSLDGPLTAIGAAVVGVIFSLALYFATRVFWPEGFGGRLDVASAAIAVAALLLLIRLQIPVLLLLVLCAAAGFAVSG